MHLPKSWVLPLLCCTRYTIGVMRHSFCENAKVLLVDPTFCQRAKGSSCYHRGRIVDSLIFHDVSFLLRVYKFEGSLEGVRKELVL